MDRLCESGGLNGIFWNKRASETVKEAKKTFGFQQSQIFPIANYVEGTTTNITQDELALLALNSIVVEGALEYIKNYFI